MNVAVADRILAKVHELNARILTEIHLLRQHFTQFVMLLLPPLASWYPGS